MRHPRVVGLAVIAVVAMSVIMGASASAASASHPGSRAGTRYAKVRRVCPAPKRRRASCFALALVSAPAGAVGASSYQLSAGAVSTGPAGGLTPADLASAYSYSPSAGGTGQTVAIVDAYDDPKIEKDLGTFDSHYGLAACTTANGCFEKVGQTGSTTSLPSADTSGWSVEITLDVETVHSICANCKILLVEANSESFADLAAAVNEAVNLGATEVSNSYGGLETGVGKPEQAAYSHPGIVIAASAGDSGYLNWDYVAEAGEAPGTPDAPASLASVVAVGGTSLELNANGTRKSESVWNDSGRPSVAESFKQFSATGGGCSTLFTAPSWQQSAPGWANTACGTKRLDNDISAVADPYTGFDIYDSYAFEPKFKAGWLTVGGTSLSSPLISALYGLAGGSHGVSYPAATLYTHVGQASSLYDVTEGGNGYCDGEAPGPCGEPEVNELLGNVDCVGTTSCDAAAGFDGPSGVGAPNGLGAFGALSESKPTVVTGAASAVKPASAVLNATVNPNGGAVSACTFEYGPSASYGHSVPCSSLPGSGTSPVAVSAPLAGLNEGVTYHFRIVATNPAGTGEGADQAFTTASPPEYGRCVKLAKGAIGEYSTAACTAPATAEKHSFEWEPGPGPKAKYTTRIKELTVATLETVGKKQVVCKGEASTGEYAGPKKVGSVVITFTGCEMGGSRCASAGAGEGEVVTKTLEGALGVEKASPEGAVKDKIATDLFPVGKTGALIEFSCGSTPVSVDGSVLDPVKSNTMQPSATLKYAASSGRQKPERLEGLPADVLEASFGEVAFEQSGLKLTTIQANEEKIEVNSVV